PSPTISLTWPRVIVNSSPHIRWCGRACMCARRCGYHSPHECCRSRDPVSPIATQSLLDRRLLDLRHRQKGRHGHHRHLPVRLDLHAHARQPEDLPGAEHFNEYAKWLRTMGAPAVPHDVPLWIVRVLLVVAVWLHIQAAT